MCHSPYSYCHSEPMFSYRTLVCWSVYFNKKLGLWSMPSNFNTAIFAVLFELAYSLLWSVDCSCVRTMRLKWSGWLQAAVCFVNKRTTCAFTAITKVWLTLILRRSRTGTVWFYTSTSNKRAARPKLYTKSLTRDLKRMYSRFTLVRISINL